MAKANVKLTAVELKKIQLADAEEKYNNVSDKLEILKGVINSLEDQVDMFRATLKVMRKQNLDDHTSDGEMEYNLEESIAKNKLRIEEYRKRIHFLLGRKIQLKKVFDPDSILPKMPKIWGQQKQIWELEAVELERTFGIGKPHRFDTRESTQFEEEITDRKAKLADLQKLVYDLQDCCGKIAAIELHPPPSQSEEDDSDKEEVRFDATEKHYNFIDNIEYRRLYYPEDALSAFEELMKEYEQDMENLEEQNRNFEAELIPAREKDEVDKARILFLREAIGQIDKNHLDEHQWLADEDANM